MIENFLNINNEELKELLNFVSDDPIFFADEMRLLSKDEILNYKDELCVEIEDIIPLIDLFNNEFVIYDINNNTFALLDIAEEFIFERFDSIENYLELLRE